MPCTPCSWPAVRADSYLVAADGSALAQLRTDPHYDGYPAWSR